jgi:hypothetical protein
MPTISGTVLDDTGAAVAGRVVRAYRRDTGALLAEVLSSDGLSSADPDFTSVALLLPFDEAENASTFADASNNALSGGIAADSPFVSQLDGPFAGAGCLNLNGGIATVTAASALDLTAGTAYTLEFFIKLNALPTNSGSLVFGWGAGVYMDMTTAGAMSFLHGSGQSCGTASTSAWKHVAISALADGTRRTFLDGALIETQNWPGGVDSAGMFFGGSNGSTGASFRVNAKLAQFRLTIGVARYTAAFTAPDTPFPTGASTLGAGDYEITTAHTGECNVVCLDNAGGTTYNDLILRTTPV